MPIETNTPETNTPTHDSPQTPDVHRPSVLYPVAAGLLALSAAGLGGYAASHRGEFKHDLSVSRASEQRVHDLQQKAEHDQAELNQVKKPSVVRVKYVSGEWQRLDKQKSIANAEHTEVRQDEAIIGGAIGSLVLSAGAGTVLRRQTKRMRRQLQGETR